MPFEIQLPLTLLLYATLCEFYLTTDESLNVGGWLPKRGPKIIMFIHMVQNQVLDNHHSLNLSTLIYSDGICMKQIQYQTLLIHTMLTSLDIHLKPGKQMKYIHVVNSTACHRKKLRPRGPLMADIQVCAFSSITFVRPLIYHLTCFDVLFTYYMGSLDKNSCLKTLIMYIQISVNPPLPELIDRL